MNTDNCGPDETAVQALILVLANMEPEKAARMVARFDSRLLLCLLAGIEDNRRRDYPLASSVSKLAGEQMLPAGSLDFLNGLLRQADAGRGAELRPANRSGSGLADAGFVTLEAGDLAGEKQSESGQSAQLVIRRLQKKLSRLMPLSEEDMRRLLGYLESSELAAILAVASDPQRSRIVRHLAPQAAEITIRDIALLAEQEDWLADSEEACLHLEAELRRLGLQEEANRDSAVEERDPAQASKQGLDLKRESIPEIERMRWQHRLDALGNISDREIACIMTGLSSREAALLLLTAPARLEYRLLAALSSRSSSIIMDELANPDLAGQINPDLLNRVMDKTAVLLKDCRRDSR